MWWKRKAGWPYLAKIAIAVALLTVALILNGLGVPGTAVIAVGALLAVLALVYF